MKILTIVLMTFVSLFSFANQDNELQPHIRPGVYNCNDNDVSQVEVSEDNQIHYRVDHTNIGTFYQLDHLGIIESETTDVVIPIDRDFYYSRDHVFDANDPEAEHTLGVYFAKVKIKGERVQGLVPIEIHLDNSFTISGPTESNILIFAEDRALVENRKFLCEPSTRNMN